PPPPARPSDPEPPDSDRCCPGSPAPPQSTQPQRPSHPGFSVSTRARRSHHPVARAGHAALEARALVLRASLSRSLGQKALPPEGPALQLLAPEFAARAWPLPAALAGAARIPPH